LETTPSVCAERGLLVTEAYEMYAPDPPVLRRAKALAHVLDHMTVRIDDDELIVGNQASAPRAAPLFPEYAVDFLVDEIDDFPHRRADVYTVSDEARQAILGKIGPYWRGKTLYDRAKAMRPSEVNQAEQIGAIAGRGNISSGDGHIIMNIPKVLREGLAGIVEEVRAAREQVSPYDAAEFHKRAFFEGATIALQAAIRFANRYAAEAERQAAGASDALRKSELLQIAEVCRRVPAAPARTFHEAVQSAWFVHLVSQIESNGHSFSLGRFDQYTYPFYRASLETGAVTSEQAQELLELLWLKLFSIIKIRPWSHTRYGIGYPTYQNVTIGGQTPTGQDATNDISYMVLETIRETRLTQPNVSARIHTGTPDRFLMECARTIRTGMGMPAIKNDEIIVPALLEKGVRSEDAYDYAIVGCIEASVPGKWGYRNTGMSFLNLLKVLELTLNDGADPATGIQLLRGRGDLAAFDSIEALYDAYGDQLRFYARLSIEMDTVADLCLEEMVPDAFCSALVDDCVARGKTIKEGGAVYDIISGLQSGAANVADCFMALKTQVFDEKSLTPSEVRESLAADFRNPGGEVVRQRLLHAPKYGNDIAGVDAFAARVLSDYLAEASRYRHTRASRGPIGGGYAGSTSNISANVPLGASVGATPDGRRAGEPINEGVSPVHGCDTGGPTKVLCSAARLPTIKSLAQLLNLRLSPGTLESEEGLRRLVALLKGFRNLKLWHVQFNTVSTQALLDAQQHPEKYRDLVVRVAGYSALFVALDKATQDDIIRRTSHDLSRGGRYGAC
jgi:formate C-acetyltransferase